MSVVSAWHSKGHRSHSDLQSNNGGSAHEIVRNAVPSFACSTSLHRNGSWHRNTCLPSPTWSVGCQGQHRHSLQWHTRLAQGWESTQKPLSLSQLFAEEQWQHLASLWGCTSQLLLSFCLVSLAFSLRIGKYTLPDYSPSSEDLYHLFSGWGFSTELVL